ncbi:helix-turn-helix domain-containing protein [Erwinia sorbitola]|uniref:Helix-turn-helix domain-containing protein n=1 Tax=Erwinia sorbitola TaxID=2681984 RepID=A0ABW9REP1_9GAMM|nr:AraC family transcriptional regulator [Erwinia sorbitola]MTD28663.1 helix-turn-helix domain-containing protein [Erwinia sorbitola]
MLIPVNFLLSLVCVLLLVQRRDGGRVFQLLLWLCLLHSLIAGLAIMLPDEKLWHRLQPITAAALPLMCRMALVQAMEGSVRIVRSALVVILMIVCVLLLPQGIDWLMPAIWLGCAVLMLRRLKTSGNLPPKTAPTDGTLTLRGWQLLALLLIVVALLDVVITLLMSFAEGAGTAELLLAGNLSMAGVMSLLLLLGHPSREPVVSRVAREVSAADPAIMARIDALMQEGLYREPQLNLARLARKAGIPTRQVSAAINALHQQSVSQYVNGWRIREAGERLAGRSQTVIEVMESVGFQTKSNFNREFRRITGKTPSEWRREAWEQAENN